MIDKLKDDAYTVNLGYAFVTFSHSVRLREYVFDCPEFENSYDQLIDLLSIGWGKTSHDLV